ncbi:hypothetical protein [Kitasatospora purpeofusca]|uniref:hypothetical protein n=1 Tax=Kitasatospora purpeofusca TaxID=67352 RepID=UPI000B066974|nr:hypothetical protein [Kitasatospora purpeofusca]
MSSEAPWTPDDLDNLLASVPTRNRARETDIESRPTQFVLPPPYDPRSGHPPQNTPPARTTNIGVLANRIENFNQETRRRDVLDGTEIDRAGLRDSPAFFLPPEWSSAWSAGAEALRPSGTCGVLIVVSRRGYGVTTFAQHLAARHSTDSVLLDLEADWSHPSVGRLPIEPRHTLLLELKDPETDRFDSGFMHHLASYAGKLRQCGSRLILTVTTELLKGHHPPSGAGIEVVRLTAPPDAQQLVEHRLKAKGHASLVQYVRSTSARNSIRGRDAVEAVRCVETVLQQWSAHQRQRTGPGDSSTPGLIARPVRVEHLASQTAPPDGLQSEIELALADWRADFDVLFGDPGERPVAEKSPLSLSDRCLLLTLAVHRVAPASVIGADAHALEAAVVTESGGPRPVSSPSLGTIFARRGLRPRLAAMSAEVDPQDRVTFDRPGYAEAVIDYAWDNFPPLRDVLLAWLVHLPIRSRAEADPAPRALSALILRHGKAEHLDKVKDLTVDANRASLLVDVTEQVLADEHMSGTAWRLLTKWAKQGKPLRAVVADVCRRVLTSADSTPRARRLAMTRVRNLVQTDDLDIRAQVLDILDGLAGTTDTRPLLVREVDNWLVKDWPPSAGRLALLALMSCTDARLPWLLGANSPFEDTQLRRGLQDLFGNLADSAEAVARTTAWLRARAADPAAADIVAGRVAPSLRGRSRAPAVVELLQALRETVLPDGSRASDLLFERIAPEAASDPSLSNR